MKTHRLPSPWRRATLAEGLSFVTALAVVSTAGRGVARWNPILAGVLLAGLSLATIVLGDFTRSLAFIAIRLSVAGPLLLVPFGKPPSGAMTTADYIRILFVPWIIVWSVMTVGLPLILIRLAGWLPGEITRERVRSVLKQIPMGFLLFLLALALTLPFLFAG